MTSLGAGDPPGPRGLPFFGCVGELRRSPMDFFTETARRYGGIARIPLGKSAVYLVSDPVLLRELLIERRDQFMKNVRYRAMQRLLGLGLLLSEGDAWRRQRALSQSSFTPVELDRQVEWMARVVARVLDGWSAFDPSEPVEIEVEFLRLTQLLSGLYLIGPDFEEIAEPFFRTSERIRSCWPRPRRGILSGLLPQKKSRMAGLHAAFEELDELVLGVVRARLRSGDPGDGVLGELIRSSGREGRPFDETELRDQVVTLFVAGYETTATAMCWTHYFLHEHPDVRRRLIEEVDGTLAGRDPGPDDLKRLTYVEQVFLESMRLYSPIHSLSRIALEDTTIGGYLVPEGATVVVSLYATHRLPQYWPDPDAFDPDRFAPGREEARHKLAYIPFAAGHRNCIGGNVAMIEGKLILAQLAQRFELELAPGHRVEPMAATTMRPRHGMKVLLRPRAGSARPATPRPAAGAAADATAASA